MNPASSSRARRPSCLRAVAVALLIILRGSATSAAPSSDDEEWFERHIRPLLVNHCVRCHGADKQESDLRVDSLQGLLEGGVRGPALVPHAPNESLLLNVLRGTAEDKLQMPPDDPLSPESIEAVERWIGRGAVWPTTVSSPALGQPLGVDFAERLRHWSFQPIAATSPAPPADTTWARNDVDAFILQRLAEANLEPAPPAEKLELLRRVHFDLTGLPPTAEQAQAFLSDESPDAYERVVDQLLASPHYGEQWAHRWLDLVRYAESTGHECDYEIGHVWPYRDYLIRAFNDDLPYDQLLREHLAGDLIERPRLNPRDQTNESIVATAFWWLGQAKVLPVDLRQEQWDRIDNQIDVLSKTFLGLTVSCARCHDHKFDPVTNEDFYALAAYIQDTRQQHALLYDESRMQQQIEELDAARHRLQDDWIAGMTRMPLLATHQPRDPSLDSLPFSRYRLPAAGIWLSGLAIAWGMRRFSRRHAVWLSLAGVWSLVVFATWTSLNLRAEQSAGDRLVPSKTASEELSSQLFASQRRQQLATLKASSDRSDYGADVVFDDFSQGYRQWSVSGHAFGESPTKSPTLHPGPDADADAQVIPPGVAYSGVRSGRLPGVLRSRTFPVSHKYIHYRVQRTAGERVLPALNQRESEANCLPMLQGPIRLVVDGYQLVPQIRYGGLVLDVPSSNDFIWLTQEVAEWQGEQSYIEIRDEDDGWIAVESIVFSDNPSPPPTPNQLILKLMIDRRFSHPTALHAQLAQWCEETLTLWSNGTLHEREDCADRIEIVNIVMQSAHRTRDPQSLAWQASLDTLRSLEASLPQPKLVLATRQGSGGETRVQPFGNPHQPGEAIAPRFLEALIDTDESRASTFETRLDLADHLTSRDNPLVARVVANRVWQRHFGRGLVPTPDDFGHMGEPPTHPELLDYLASQLVDRDWSLKSLHRLIVTSSAYRMSSRLNPAADQLDPDNRLFHRMELKRLDGEMIRDAVLAVSGRLDRMQFGPGIEPHLTGGVRDTLDAPTPGPLDGDGRRSIYLKAYRNSVPRLFIAFDEPQAETTTGRRSVSNVPEQLLVLLDDPFVVDQAERWAHRIGMEHAGDLSAAIDRMYWEAYARPASASERQRGVAFVQSAEAEKGEPSDRALAELARALLNSKEFSYLP